MKGATNLQMKNILFLFFFTLIISSCAYRNSNRILTYPKSFNTDTLKTVAVLNNNSNYSEYKIKPFDKISIKNLQDPELLGARNVTVGTLPLNYKVNAEGYIILPVIGSVKISGLNKEDAKNKIEKLYSDNLFNNPIIELTINSLKVTLLGAFKVEGNIELGNEKIDLIDMIGLAGGIAEDANIKTIRIIRGDRKNPELIMVNLSNINSLSNSKLILQDGDIIIAERTKFSILTKNLAGINTLASVGILVLNTYLIIKTIKQ